MAALTLAALGPVSPADAAPGDVGVPGRTFAGSPPAPTGEKPQSKLWFNDGTWWADAWHPGTRSRHIWRLDRARQIWIDARTVLDARPNTRSDVLWDGSRLYVLSHINAASSAVVQPHSPTLLFRYAYNPTTKRYTLDRGFPTKVNDVSAEAAVLSKDALNRLWVTWTQGRRVYAVRSARYGTSWERPFVLPLAGASGLNADDLSTVATYGSVRTGIAWSSQQTGTLWFASHDDRAAAQAGWTASVITRGSKRIDDHVSLRTLEGDRSGRLYAVSKTGEDDRQPYDPANPLVELHVRNPSGSWSTSVVGVVGDNPTRPILALDKTNQQVLVLYTGPNAAGSRSAEGSIYVKRAPLSAPVFPSGKGTPVIRDAASAHINNVTTTKQTLSAATGLVVLAGDDTTHRYWHADIPLR